MHTQCIYIYLHGYTMLSYIVGDDLTVSSTVAHAVTAAHAVLDITCISAMPVRILHTYIPMIFGAVYGVFTAVYDMSGGTGSHGEPYIYKVMMCFTLLPSFICSLGVMPHSYKSIQLPKQKANCYQPVTQNRS